MRDAMDYGEAVAVAKRALELIPVSEMEANGYDREEVEEAIEVLEKGE